MGKIAGRPRGTTMLTDELQKQIVDCLTSGLAESVTCHSVGISHASLLYWKNLGEKEGPGGRHYALLQAVKKATALGELELVKIIKAASYAQWQAAAWLLERKHWVRWAKRERLDIKQETKGGVAPVLVVDGSGRMRTKDKINATANNAKPKKSKR